MYRNFNKRQNRFSVPENRLFGILSPGDLAQKLNLDNSLAASYTVPDAAKLLRSAFALLDNCTRTAQTVPDPVSSKGDTDMAQVHRQRIYIGSEDNSSNGVKWVQGKSVD